MSSIVQIQSLLQALRDREVNFREFVKMLRAEDMPVGQGWDGLMPKYKSLPADVDLGAYAETLSSIYKNHYRYENRAVVVIDLGQNDAQAVAHDVAKWVDASSPFLATFPLPLAQGNLKKAPSSPVPTSVINFKTGEKTLVSCSKRYVRSREPIDYSEFDEDVRHALAAYDEVIGVRSRFVQAFDTLMLDVTKGRAILTVDLCGKLSLQDVGRHIEAHLAMLDEKLEELGIPNASERRINFFPKIETLYNEQNGLVERLGHVTSSGSNKIERMRNKSKDLRQEPFHLRGLEAIGGGTSRFLIAKRWNVADYQYCVTIPGNHKQINDPDATISAAVFEGCRNRKDFLAALEHLLK
jgi:hypothetical protein